MSKYIGLILGVTLFCSSVSAMDTYYGRELCKRKDFICTTIKKGMTWEQFLPDERERDLVMRLNRTDTYLSAGRVIAMPVDLPNTTLEDISPFAERINTKNKIIIVNQMLLAWGAYDENGQLVKWGPISTGKDYCPDVKRSCKTVTGEFHIFTKKDYNCRSNTYPVGRGGSHMPYCMFFHHGYALHGSPEVVGYRDSHGCVRMFTDDAKWLNHNFVEVATPENGGTGTKVVVEQLIES